MSRPPTILVINPSSSIPMTEAISTGLDRFRLPGGPAIECFGIAEGPEFIMTEEDILRCGLQVGEVVASRPDAAAIVIACYAQPGLHHARTLTKAPVIGIQDAAVLTAIGMADRFGVIALSKASVARHMRNLRWLGVEHRLAGEVVLKREGEGDDALFAGLVAAGEELKAKGAEVAIFGCSGFPAHRARLEEALGIPVIDPTQTAIGAALGQVLRSF
ncbi:aspartate/glutamate racemase family protein [Rhizobium terrae]|uniref:aspartate/glutamate racemase family protein n=1 Tax=Rhizobium terrae TaxID=2171756 RepID=UPI0013C312F5|nr:aspartate/glutamate racemase family protein [Rhizobium terrae]